MLPAAHRMHRSAEFAAAVRTGRRARGDVLVVVHQRIDSRPAPAVVGLVVGRSIGSSVIRHRVSRRLRAQLSARLDRLPTGSATVVRALPPAADARSDRLGHALDVALGRLEGPGRG